jgi:hypothetical protein
VYAYGLFLPHFPHHELLPVLVIAVCKQRKQGSASRQDVSQQVGYRYDSFLCNANHLTIVYTICALLVAGVPRRMVASGREVGAAGDKPSLTPATSCLLSIDSVFQDSFVAHVKPSSCLSPRPTPFSQISQPSCFLVPSPPNPSPNACLCSRSPRRRSGSRSAAGMMSYKDFLIRLPPVPLHSCPLRTLLPAPCSLLSDLCFSPIRCRKLHS